MIRCFKFTGAGNSFLFIDARRDADRKSISERFSKLKRHQIAKYICNSNESIGADGLLFIENSQVADVKWDFYNADGSRAEMCGNAARCVGKYLLTFPQDISTFKSSDKITLPQSFTLETRAGVISLIVSEQKVSSSSNSLTYIEAEMPLIKDLTHNLKLKIGSKILTFDFVNSGVPHAVFKVANFRSLKNLVAAADQLSLIVTATRKLPRFKKSGTNVTFFTPRSREAIDSLTFERGVNGYTQACGTGAVAAAVSFTGGVERILQVNVPGGKLKVDLTHNRPHLVGPTKFIGEIII